MSSEKEPSPEAGISDVGAVTRQAWNYWLSNNETMDKVDQLQSELTKIQSSRSWKITAPLRAFFRLLSANSPHRRITPPLQPPSGGGAFIHLPVALRNAVIDRMFPDWAARIVGSDRANSLFVDVTELALADLGAGTQRSTRRLLCELLHMAPAGFVVEPVRLASDGSFVSARAFLSIVFGLPTGALGPDCAVLPKQEDVYLGLDVLRDRYEHASPAIRALRSAGVTTNFIVHDVLPLTNPQWFPIDVPAQFERWLRVLSEQGDRAICISDSTRKELDQAMRDRGLARPQGMDLVTLGSDFQTESLASVLPKANPGVVRVLMVGTLEPRKGHAQALAAIAVLASRATRFELVIAGHAGWAVESLQSELVGAIASGLPVRWLPGASDRDLQGLYRECDLLLMASHGEGYGLPISEAGRAGCELLLRDIPVFREVAGPAANYFSGDSPDELANAIAAWHESGKEHRADPQSARWPTWATAAAQLAAICLPATGDPG
jgi:glycosyltransferase involved in cell wall biosynthesis